MGSQGYLNLRLHIPKYEIYRVFFVSGIQGLPCGGHLTVGFELAGVVGLVLSQGDDLPSSAYGA